MKKINQSPFSKELLKKLRGSTAEERFLHKLHCIVLCHAGYTAKAVGEIYGDSARAVSYWLMYFNEKGEDSLRDKARPGRPKKLNAAQMRKVKAFAEKSALQGNPISAPALSRYIKETFNVDLTGQQCWRFLKKFKK